MVNIMELTISNVHNKLLDAFNKVKRDVHTLKDLARNQNERIAALQNNEKALLVRIRKLETEIDKLNSKKSQVKVVEKVVKKTVPRKRKYYGAKTSMKLHDEDCPFAKNIKPENKVVFRSKVKPFNMGYEACTCLKK